MNWNTITTDVLVIGGGGAGLRAALQAESEGARVVLVCKGVSGRSGSTKMAYPAINAAFNNLQDGDSVKSHFEDFVAGGHGLCDEDLAFACAEGMTERIAELEAFGTEFGKNEDGTLAQIQHPGHSHARTLLMKNGGAGMLRGLCKELARRSNITVLDDAIALQLLANDKGCCGALVLDTRKGEGISILSGAVIMATGGYEAMWQHTDVSPETTGDGLLLAYEAGAPLIDLEMILYYPFIGCSDKGRGVMLQYESLVHPGRFGGRMLDAADNDLLKGAVPPPRDEMLRIMEAAAAAGNAGPNGGVYLDLSQCGLTEEKMDELARLYFGIPLQNLRLQGIDPAAGLVEVKPGLHYSLGGIRVKADCTTGLPGLYAAGECTGNLHGSNRLSGNALAETQAFGYISGRNAAIWALQAGLPAEADTNLQQAKLAQQSRLEALLTSSEKSLRPSECKARLRAVMEQFVGRSRSAEGLAEGLRCLRALEAELPALHADGAAGLVGNAELGEALSVQNMVQLAALIAESAACRRETRGHHIRTDYPETDPAWAVHTCVRKGETVSTVPVAKL